MLAHHAVRRLIHEAAENVGEDPDRRVYPEIFGLVFFVRLL